MAEEYFHISKPAAGDAASVAAAAATDSSTTDAATAAPAKDGPLLQSLLIKTPLQSKGLPPPLLPLRLQPPQTMMPIAETATVQMPLRVRTYGRPLRRPALMP